MSPSSLSIPTDNIYKFGCLFGLAIIISSVVAFVSIYSSSLEKKITYSEVIIRLKEKSYRTPQEQELLTLNERLLEVTVANQKFADKALGVLAGVGIFLSFVAFLEWYRVIQKRDDKLADLQLKKLELEIEQAKFTLRKQHSFRYRSR